MINNFTTYPFIDRFIAERGHGGQLLHVEKIDSAFNLKPMPNVGNQTVQQILPAVDPQKLIPIKSFQPRSVKDSCVSSRRHTVTEIFAAVLPILLTHEIHGKSVKIVFLMECTEG
jgi:hypothetical protein